MPVIATPSQSALFDCDLPDLPDGEAPVGDGVAASEPVVEPLRRGPGECQFDCDHVFANLRVIPTIKFGTRVEWSLHPRFRDPQPHTFQLQVGTTGLSMADDWQAVGLPANDVYFMDDDSQRVFGKHQWTHYRICLTTPNGTYFSRPVDARGDLSFRDLSRIRSIQKTWDTLLRAEEGSEGFLLKRKIFGDPCPNDCIDWQTFEVSNPQCEVCHGTGFLSGYYDPLPCVYAALNQRARLPDRNPKKGLTDDKLVVGAKMLANPQLFRYDVWVDKKNDYRWIIHAVQNRVEYRGKAVVVDVEMRFAPFSHPIYSIQMPG